MSQTREKSVESSSKNFTARKISSARRCLSSLREHLDGSDLEIMEDLDELKLLFSKLASVLTEAGGDFVEELDFSDVTVDHLDKLGIKRAKLVFDLEAMEKISNRPLSVLARSRYESLFENLKIIYAMDVSCQF